ncbi:hypothetical protein AAFF_G00193340 [Aldrovandia affinis]|uniref:Ig-like domain-containing protein n=1 Tax=Aldrovandia affinis TaxID=143900 RepID=A0AAD7WVE5_9TELE|nr:hypothetical protein AAFF_G00193340 [Aldrovandia affinis]
MENAFFTYFILFLTFGWGQGRVVRVPESPLVRVEGQAVSVRCSVSDYEGPREQDFEWKVVRGADSLQLISTFDPSYSDRYFQDRVDSGDIAVERLGDDTVELRIQNMKASDSATYRCSTPSTDSIIKGNYDANVELKVIGDSLKVSPAAPPAVVPEGGPIELRCNATLDPAENTYLSVTWSIRKGASSEDILTFGPDTGVTTGDGSRQRYADAGLRVDLQGGGAYGLVLTEARPADQGVYVCTAREWVREKGGVWQQVLERTVEMGEVQVTPTAQSLMVTVEDNSTLSVDDTLNLTCTVNADDLSALGLEVTWLVSPDTGGSPSAPRVLVHINWDGVVTDSSGLVGVSRVGVGAFRLVVRGVDRSDSGLYSCRVQAWVRQSSREWYQAADKTSAPALVLVTVIEPEFKVALGDVVTPQVSGDPTELECRVTDVLRLQDGRLAVSWHYAEATPADMPASVHPVATVDERGNLQPGDAYRERVEKGLLVLSRVEPDTFRLRFLRTQDSDMGQYSCTASAWNRGRDGSWAKSKEVRSDPLGVHWVPKNPTLSVSAQPLKEATSAGSTFEMSCQATAENLQSPGYSVLIHMEETAGGKARKILSLGPDSVLKLEEWNELGRLDSVVLEKTGATEFRFRLYGAQVTDRGLYYCDVTAWTPGPGNSWDKAVSAASNKIPVNFADTGPAFNVSIQSDAASVLPGGTAKMECIMTLGASPNAGDVSYEVRWYHSRLQSLDRPTQLATMDRLGVVRKSPRNGSGDCSLEQTDAQTFALRIHGAQERDTGEYHCTATPWLRSPSGAWTSGHDLTSDRVFLSVTFSMWDSLKLPLLYGTGASLAVGLLSILLGFVCTQCCCRNAKHTPRTRNGLMDLEMD